MLPYEPCHEKTCFAICEQQRRRSACINIVIIFRMFSEEEGSVPILDAERKQVFMFQLFIYM